MKFWNASARMTPWLEGRAKVAKKKIADFERGSQIPYERTLHEIELALRAAGVAFIPENGGGAGVRLKEALPRRQL